MNDTLIIDPSDNVMIALRAFKAGELLAPGVIALDDIPAGHKVARRTIGGGENVLKFGCPIGTAVGDLAAGRHVHTHNIRSLLADDLKSPAFDERVQADASQATTAATFRGYRRPDGRAATRNEIWIVNTVGCVNQAAQRIAAIAHRELAGQGVDGVYAFPHQFGCSQLGDDLYHTQLVLAGLVNHPNAAAVLIIGLGCENNQIKLFLEKIGSGDREFIRYFNAQDVSDEVEQGVQHVRELAERISARKREEISAAELIIGMKCGGSDGFSGITANPLVGRMSDKLAANGATVLLSEVPEMFGAEQFLLDRTSNAAVFQQTVNLVNDFRAYFRKYDQPIDENPSPGNKEGGISTLAEKSLGCVQKAGRAPVKSVLAYGWPASSKLGGVALVNAPGNDGISSTAMTVAGAHTLLFTTGRGTPMGFPVPTLKISSNSDLAGRKPNWIDFNAGDMITNGRDIDELANDLFTLLLNTCSGRPAKNELNDQREIAIWKDGVTL